MGEPVARCETCQGRNRETTNMVCMACGRDYMPDDGSDETGPGLGWKRLMGLWRELAKRALRDREVVEAEMDHRLAEARKAALEDAADLLARAGHHGSAHLVRLHLIPHAYIEGTMRAWDAVDEVSWGPLLCRTCAKRPDHPVHQVRTPPGPISSVTTTRTSPRPGGVQTESTQGVPGVEVGTLVVLDLDAVRAGHVPWPGDADDGTCSCCGMPHPCVTRRLADEVDRLRSFPLAEQYNAELVRRLQAEAAVVEATERIRVLTDDRARLQVELQVARGEGGFIADPPEPADPLTEAKVAEAIAAARANTAFMRRLAERIENDGDLLDRIAAGGALDGTETTR